MGENNNNVQSGESGQRRDAAIDFSRYDMEQLVELRDSIDPTTSSHIHAALVAELERRESAPSNPPQWTGRLTSRDGLLGWLQAKWRRQPLYGEGILGIEDQTVVLHGRQRTWLGMPIERALSWPMDRTRNVAHIRTGVRFEVKRQGWFARHVQLDLPDTEQAAALAAALPQAQTARFARQGQSLIAFEEHLRRRCSTAWLTPTLVLLNTLLFVIACASSGQIWTPATSRLVFWTANIGPLTLDGQWWRPLTAIFTHGSVLHLVFNMWALWHIGKLVERLFGRWMFVSIYLATGILASLFSLVWDPARSSVGASGAIFGLFGAFLATLVHPGIKIPRGVFRAHWIPTLLFTGYSLISGATTPGVDNAAHVGGLISGLVFGFLLSRPVEVATTVRGWRSAAAALLLVACSGVAVLYLRNAGGPPPAPQQFANNHQWYVTGESRNLALWDRLAAMAAAGTISDEQLGTRFENEIAPFWESALPKLQTDALHASGPEGEYLAAVVRFAQIRRDWVQAIIKATKDQDSAKAEESRKKMDEITVAIADIQRLALRSTAAQRKGGLINLPITGKVRKVFAGGSTDCIKEPDNDYDTHVSDTDSRSDGPAMRVEAGCNAQRLFLDADFKELDAALARQAGHIGDLPDGGSSLHASVDGISDHFTYGRDSVDNQLRRLADWRRAEPDSIYPDLLEAILFSDWAWSARGHGTSKQVSQQAWAAFAFRTEMSWMTLQGARPPAQQSLVGCRLSMRLQHDRSVGLPELRKTLDSCLSRHPGDFALYYAMLRSLMPRWFGSKEEIATFINEVAAAGTSGADELYARLFAAYSSMERDEFNIFEDGLAEWPRMQSGFESLLQRHPGSDAVANEYARFACLAHEPRTYKSLRTRMNGRLSATAWTKATTVVECDRLLGN